MVCSGLGWVAALAFHALCSSIVYSSTTIELGFSAALWAWYVGVRAAPPPSATPPQRRRSEALAEKKRRTRWCGMQPSCLQYKVCQFMPKSSRKMHFWGSSTESEPWATPPPPLCRATLCCSPNATTTKQLSCFGGCRYSAITLCRAEQRKVKTFFFSKNKANHDHQCCKNLCTFALGTQRLGQPPSYNEKEIHKRSTFLHFWSTFKSLFLLTNFFYRYYLFQKLFYWCLFCKRR